jgi:uncharacterized protein (DUF58 family)
MVVASFYLMFFLMIFFGAFNLFFDMKKKQKLNLFLFITATSSFYSIIFNYQYVFFASFLILIIVVMAFLWSENIFARFTIKRGLSKSKVFIGEKVNYELEVENRKLLSAPRITIKDNVTEGVEFVNDRFLASVPGVRTNIFNDNFSLKWYEKVKKRYEIKVQQRGYYKIGEGNIFYYGIFGLFKNQISEKNYTELVVFPRILPAKKIGIELRQLFGTRQSEGWIHKDPLNKVGVRPYQTTDSVKEINWKATARHRELVSDVFKPSYDHEVHIFLSNRTTKDWWDGIIKNHLELSIIYAASVVNYGINNGFQVGLYSDGLIKNSRKYISLPPDQSKSHQNKLLTTLAMIKAANQIKLSKILYREKKNINPGSTVIIIGSYLSSETEKMINLYKKYYNLHLIKIGNDNEEQNRAGINTHYIDGQEEWDKIKQLDFEG